MENNVEKSLQLIDVEEINNVILEILNCDIENFLNGAGVRNSPRNDDDSPSSNR